MIFELVFNSYILEILPDLLTYIDYKPIGIIAAISFVLIGITIGLLEIAKRWTELKNKTK